MGIWKKLIFDYKLKKDRAIYLSISIGVILYFFLMNYISQSEWSNTFSNSVISFDWKQNMVVRYLPFALTYCLYKKRIKIFEKFYISLSINYLRLIIIYLILDLINIVFGRWLGLPHTSVFVFALSLMTIIFGYYVMSFLIIRKIVAVSAYCRKMNLQVKV